MGLCGSTHADILPFSGNGPTRLTKEQIQVIDKYMPDFRIYEQSTERHRYIAATHWNTVFREEPSSGSRSGQRLTRTLTPKSASDSRIGMLYNRFYEYLDEHSPELKPMFRSSMHIRSKVLVHISAGMRSILASDQALEKTMVLTKTHIRFGVKLEHFNALGKALMHAMRIASEDVWTRDIEDAWRRLFAHCTAILLVHHKKALHRHTLPAHLEVSEDGAYPGRPLSSVGFATG